MTRGLPLMRRELWVSVAMGARYYGASRWSSRRCTLKRVGRESYGSGMRFVTMLLTVAGSLLLCQPASAQLRETPYWASLRADKVNMRVGPSGEYAIDWVYQREDLPVKVLRIKNGWRLVQDPDGAEGWIAARLLSREQTAIVIGKGLADMRDSPGREGRLLWHLEPGVIGKLGDCETGWCELDVEGHRGWVEQSRLWGAGAP